MEKSVLILGEADAGKTHYGAQLMIRLEEGKSTARNFAPPENIEPFADAMRDLNDGKAAGHTSGQSTKQSVLHIEFPGGIRADVAWPEYAGERLKDLVHSRRAGESWRKSATESSAWLLLIQHEAFKRGRDLLNRPVTEWMDKRKAPGEGPVDWAAQVRVVELLQMLLFLRNSAQTQSSSPPRLAVAVSCYDTLPERETFKNPAEALLAVAPLVSAFVASNWHPNEHFIVGLSSIGKSLDKEKPDEQFIDMSPAANGWIVTPSGTQIPDLTWPLVELLRE
jgi:hypothetical protein